MYNNSIEIELCTPQKNKGFKIDKKRKQFKKYYKYGYK